MKILEIGKFYPIRGGVEKVMYDLTEGLSDMGVACDMLCATTENHPGGIIQLNSKGRIIAIPTKIKLAATTIAPAMINWMRKNAHLYDIIHIHHPDPMAALSLFLSGYKGKVVLHWHSDIVKQKTLLKFYEPLQKWLIRRSDIILGTSPVYVEHSPFLRKEQDKVSYLPIGVSPMPTDEQSVTELREQYQGKKIVFTLGRLVKYKGYEYLIQAAQYLKDDVVVLIGGIGPEKNKLQQLIDTLHLSDKVKLLGFIHEKQMAKYFHGCHLFCLSSIMKTEAFGIVQIEAMSCAKPIVSTHIEGSGVSWVNADNISGLVVPICDVVQLAEAISRILDDKVLYQKLSEGAQKRYEQEFTLSEVVVRCKAIFEQLLSSS